MTESTNNDPERFQIKPASRADAATILELLHRLARDMGQPDAIKMSLDDLLTHGFGEKPEYEALIARHDGEPVGLSLYFFNLSTWRGQLGVYVQDLYVAESARGHGLGRRLLEETAAIGRTRGCTHMRLAVDTSNQHAQAFYRRMGLEHATEEIIWRMGDTAFDRFSRRREPLR